MGGESEFFDKIVNAISGGKAVDRFVDNSHVLSDVTTTLFTGDPEVFTQHLKRFAGQFGMTSDDLKNLTVSAVLTKMTAQASDGDSLAVLARLSGAAKQMGVGDKLASAVLGLQKTKA